MSVTSESSASTSFVMPRDQHAGGAALVEADRHRLEVAEDLQAQVRRARAGRPSRRGRSARTSAPQTRSALTRNATTTRSSVPHVALEDARRRSPPSPSGAGASDAAVPITSASEHRASRAPVGRGAATISPRSLRPRPRGAAQAAAQVVAAACASARGDARRPAASQPRHLALARLAGEEDLVGQALLDDLAVELGAPRAARRACRARAARRPRARRSRRRARSSTGGGR